VAALQIQLIPTSSIILDERNPRIAHVVENSRNGTPQEWIPMALGQHAPEDQESGSASTYSSLKASIRAHKKLIVPIIVTPRPNGQYLVIEGNTRVAIFRELAEEGSEGEWSSIPAIVQTEMEEKGEHAIRLQAHLVGPRPWRPYAKAKYLHDLYINQNLSINEILDFCGGSARKKEIEQYIAAYKDMNQHYIPIVQAEGAPPDYSSFSSFIELQSIKPALHRGGFSEADFAQWVHEDRMKPQQLVRHLPRILAHPEARRQFFTHNAREAVKVLDQPNPNALLGTASLEQLATALSVRLRQIPFPEVTAMRQALDKQPAQALLGCYDELKVLADYLGPQDRG
jgi:hypothetical protein